MDHKIVSHDAGKGGIAVRIVIMWGDGLLV